MLIHTLDTIRDYDGKPAVEQRQNPDGTIYGEPITLRFLIWQALNTPLPNEPWDPADKMRCFDLTLRTHTHDEAELDPGERAYIIDRSGKINPPLAHGRLVEMLSDPKPVPVPADAESMTT